MAGDIQAVRTCAARAALNPALWPETLLRFSQIVGGDMTLLEHIYKRSNAVEIGFTDRPEVIAETRDDYEQHYGRHNPRWNLAKRLPIDAVLHDDLIGDERTLGRYEYYVDFLGQSGLRYFIGSPVADDAEQTVVLSIQRQADRGRVGADELRAFSALLPDMRNAVAMYLRMVRGPSAATLAATLDRLGDPIAVLREDGRMLFANRAMQSLLASGDIVGMDKYRITGVREGMRRAIGEAMRRAAAGIGLGLAAAPAHHEGGPIIFRVARLMPHQAHELSSGEDRLYCLMIDDPARPNWPSIDGAMRLFGLTRREATVGSHLAAGLTVNETAARLGLSRNTIRTHLAMLREKLGVRSAVAVAAELRRAATPLA